VDYELESNKNIFVLYHAVKCGNNQVKYQKNINNQVITQQHEFYLYKPFAVNFFRAVTFHIFMNCGTEEIAGKGEMLEG
jgi:hypothetical protein